MTLETRRAWILPVKDLLAHIDAFFVIGTGCAVASRFACVALAARALGPPEFGTWNLVEPIIIYAPFASLGILNGLRRELPIALGQGNHLYARQLYSTSGTYGLSFALLLCLVSTVGAWMFLSSPTAAVVAATLVAGFAYHVQQHVYSVLKAQRAFRIVGRLQMTVAVALLLLFSVSLLDAKLIYLPLSFAGAYLLVPALARRHIGWLEGEASSPNLASKIVGIGLPIMASGLFFSLLWTLDRWFVGGRYSPEELGYYSLAVIIASGLILVKSLIGEQFYPQMGTAYGARNIALTKRLVRLELLATTTILGGAAFLLIVALPLVVPRLLPAYSPGILAAQVMAAAILVTGFGSGYANLLNVVGLQNRYFLITAFSGIFAAIALFFGTGRELPLWRAPALIGLSLAVWVCLVVFVGTNAERQLDRDLPELETQII